MRHGKRNQRLSLPTEHKQSLLYGMTKSLLLHGQIRTTWARAKEAQRVADRLVSLGKEGSVHSRRQAFRVLQDRTLVKRLFAEVAPRFGDVSGGYTRVVRLGGRRTGDGAQMAVLAFSRLPASEPVTRKTTKPEQALEPSAKPAPQKPEAASAGGEKSKGFFEGLRTFWTPKKKGSGS